MEKNTHPSRRLPPIGASVFCDILLKLTFVTILHLFLKSLFVHMACLPDIIFRDNTVEMKMNFKMMGFRM